MIRIRTISVLALAAFLIPSVHAADGANAAAGEYARHFDALSQLSAEVADAMPADKYGFKPHPQSMTFGELMTHIAATNYQFCAGLRDEKPPALPTAKDKAGVKKFLDDSFQYCHEVIDNLSDAQLSAEHNSPDGRMPGRDVLLALYIHVAHHRGQAEIYERDINIKPPNYRI